MTNKRFWTTWESEDGIVYRLYIIPSNADYSSGMTDVQLPSDFLLRDGMSIDSELGDLPTGLGTQVLKFGVNIASCQGTTDLNNLRVQLLQGTTTQLVPLNVDGSQYLETITSSYHTAPTLTERQFDAFNTFILQYNDSFGFNPNLWNVAFIGCQKYASENELEITPLENVVKFSIEAYDIVRCIGEMITPTVWKVALRCDSTLINYSSTVTNPENTEYRHYLIGTDYNKGTENVNLADILDGRFWSYVSTFPRLQSKISTMYSAYFRALLRRNNVSITAPSLFQKTIKFLNREENEINPEHLLYVAEIWESSKERGIKLLSGAHADQTMFEQFTNFHEVLRMLLENTSEISIPEYLYSSTPTEAYQVVYRNERPFPLSTATPTTFQQSNTYSSLKVKILSESLMFGASTVSTIRGSSDTKEFQYGEKGTSGDNSKEVKLMFHNLPILTGREKIERVYGIAFNENNSYTRGSVNPGTLFYYDSSNPRMLVKVNTVVRFYFDGDSSSEYYWMPYPVPTPSILVFDVGFVVLAEQQNSGLATTYCYSMVKALGDKKQAEATLTTTRLECNENKLGTRVRVNLNNYNPLLQSVYNQNIVKGVLLKHSLNVYRGTSDVTIRIDAEVTA